jgi:light-regulated signal transduction histidine kinase (bacteriophytochrome)
MENAAVKIENKLKFVEDTQLAIRDISIDVEDEKKLSGDMQKAVLNILEDYSDEKKIAEDTQKALMNILEDYSTEKTIVEKMNIKLMSSNKEMEQFAFIASHDMQEPLRTISNYIGLLQNQYKGNLDKNADRYLTSISGAIFRMQSLIRDLLEYSKIGNDNNKVAIDCNVLLNHVLNDVNESIEESKAKIHAKQLPVINGYISGIKSVFQNLISNAVKFRKKEEIPIITISAETKHNEWLFTVRDNGIGIDKKYHDKIFVIFQRLHTKTEYAGTGIGLAHIKKIIEVHGGKIWFESEPEKGTTFYFTIPKTPLL